MLYILWSIICSIAAIVLLLSTQDLWATLTVIIGITILICVCEYQDSRPYKEHPVTDKIIHMICDYGSFIFGMIVLSCIIVGMMVLTISGVLEFIVIIGMIILYCIIICIIGCVINRVSSDTCKLYYRRKKV